MKSISYISLAALVAATACSDSNGWSVSGISDEASNAQTILLEASDNAGRWYTVDSIKASDSGKFAFKNRQEITPDIFRIRVASADNAIYFPIDSTETVTIVRKQGKTKLEGNLSAEMLNSAEDIIAAAGSKIFSDSISRRRLADIVLSAPDATAAYYLINRRLGTRPLFDPANRTDLRIIGAVANAFATNRPDDRRTQYVKKLFLSHHNAGKTAVVEADEIGLPKLALCDHTGKKIDLADVAGKGHPVLLVFTSLTADGGSEFDMLLRKIYDEYSDSGLQIYAVGADTDEYAWRTAAANLPWINVLLPANDRSALIRYNVGSIPTLFVIDAEGNLAERINDPTDISAAIRRHS